MAQLRGWAKRVKMTIDSSDITATLPDFPILVYLSSSCGRNSEDLTFIFDDLQDNANRKKIAVTADDGLTQRYVEIEEWDDAGEEAWLWVKVPSVASATDTVLYLYYDIYHHDNTTYVGDTNSTVAENVWDSYYKLVSHMRDNPDTSSTRDSTSNDNDGVKLGTAEPAVTTSGQISDAQDFDGINDKVTHSAISFTTENFACEFWLYYEGQSADFAGLIDGGGVWTTKGWTIGFGTVGQTRLEFIDMDDTTKYNSNNNIRPATTWTHIMVARVGANYYWYKNGVGHGNGVLGAGDFTATANDLLLSVDAAPRYTQCHLDEVRVTVGVERSSAYAKACYETQRDDLLNYGSEEICGVSGVSLRRRRRDEPVLPLEEIRGFLLAKLR